MEVKKDSVPNPGGPHSQNAKRQFRFIRFLCDDLSWAKLVRFRAGAGPYSIVYRGGYIVFHRGYEIVLQSV